jgi:hypothetical protein
VIYVIAILCPPLAILSLGKPFTAICSFISCVVILCLCFVYIGIPLVWMPSVHACVLASRAASDEQFRRQMEYQRSLIEWQQTKSTARDVQNRLGR